MTGLKPINGLENRLAGTLRPIAPRAEFIHGLGDRIRGLRETMQQAGAGTWKFLLLMLGGMLSLGLLLALLGRAFQIVLGGRDRESEQA